MQSTENKRYILSEVEQATLREIEIQGRAAADAALRPYAEQAQLVARLIARQQGFTGDFEVIAGREIAEKGAAK